MIQELLGQRSLRSVAERGPRERNSWLISSSGWEPVYRVLSILWFCLIGTLQRPWRPVIRTVGSWSDSSLTLN